jgi:hypothetical protein
MKHFLSQALGVGLLLALHELEQKTCTIHNTDIDYKPINNKVNHITVPIERQFDPILYKTPDYSYLNKKKKGHMNQSKSKFIPKTQWQP